MSSSAASNRARASEACPACGTRLNLRPRTGALPWAGLGAAGFLVLGSAVIAVRYAGGGSAGVLPSVVIGFCFGLLPAAASLAPLFLARGAATFRGGVRCCPGCEFLEIDGAERPDVKRRWRSTLSFYRQSSLWLMVSIPSVFVLRFVHDVGRDGPVRIGNLVLWMTLVFTWLGLAFAADCLEGVLGARRKPR